MMDLNALFKMPYGLYLAGVEYRGKKNACIVNTVAQVTADPARLLVTMQKNNLTSEMALHKGSLAVSVLGRDFPLEKIQRFGYHSGREMEKFDGVPFYEDQHGNPYLTEGVAAIYGLKVERCIDVDTHWLFLCSLESCQALGESNAMTYDDYRILKSGGSPDAPAAAPAKKYTCMVCHYVYDGEIPFADLPDDYVCPICGVGKEQFVLA